MTASPVVVGVDVAKDRLDVAVRPSGERWTVTNDDAGTTALVARLRPLSPGLVVCEATGGFERAAIAASPRRASVATAIGETRYRGRPTLETVSPL